MIYFKLHLVSSTGILGEPFFFPKVASEVDWTQPIEFLDKEFGKIAPDAVTGRRFADQCVPRRLA